MRGALIAACALAAIAVTIAPGPALASEQGASAYLDRIRDDPMRLRQFMFAMPKGGDIHSHLSGAVYAESVVGWAAADGRCIDTVTLKASLAPCTSGQRSASDALEDNDFYNQIIAAWSMRNFVPGAQSGHDHFFNTFNLFGTAFTGRDGDMLAEVASRAASQNEFYLELMITPESSAAWRLSERITNVNDFEAARQELLRDGGMDEAVAAAIADRDRADAAFRRVLRCGTPAADPGCNVEIRWIAQVSRSNPLEVNFAQMVLGFELAQRDDRWVAVNLVQPEDALPSLRNYQPQMRMLRYLQTVYDKGQVTLHAGELVPGLVPPRDLRFHIREAVEVAGAKRIGHGVSIREERDPIGLLREMAKRRILVEVALSSNEQVLDVRGRRAALPVYLRYGVPVALATDDEGVERTDMTEQYMKAAAEHNLSYRQLKTSARNALDYSFLQGRSFWQKPGVYDRAVTPCRTAFARGRLTPSCRRFLGASPKASVEWRQEQAFRAFEARFPSGRRARPPAVRSSANGAPIARRPVPAGS